MDYMNQIKGTITEISYPELQGSEKQVKWAKELRSSAAAIMAYEVFNEEYETVDMMTNNPVMEKRNIKDLIVKMHDAKELENYLKEREEQFASYGKEIAKERMENLIDSINNAYDRYQRVKEIISNDSAKFWIDNRGNQEKNYMYKNFAEYVSTGNKNF